MECDIVVFVVLTNQHHVLIPLEIVSYNNWDWYVVAKNQK